MSDKVAPSLLAQTFGTYGVIGVYVGLVLAVGRLFRAALDMPTHRLMYLELKHVEPLMELCSSVFIAQRQQYDGNLEDEVHLYDTLIRLYRSPEVLKQLTQPSADELPLAPPPQ